MLNRAGDRNQDPAHNAVDEIYRGTAGSVCTWGEWVAESDDAAMGERLRRHEATGRPLGELPFLERLCALLGRDLIPEEPGRRPKRRAK